MNLLGTHVSKTLGASQLLTSQEGIFDFLWWQYQQSICSIGGMQKLREDKLMLIETRYII